jgi:hypothetical protein
MRRPPFVSSMFASAGNGPPPNHVYLFWLQVIKSLVNAAQYHHLDILELLSCTNKEGQNVFHIAAARNQEEVMSALLALVQQGHLQKRVPSQATERKRVPLGFADIAPLVVALDDFQQSAVSLAADMPWRTCCQLMLVLLSWDTQQHIQQGSGVQACHVTDGVLPDNAAQRCADRLRSAAACGDVDMVRGLLTAYHQLKTFAFHAEAPVPSAVPVSAAPAVSAMTRAVAAPAAPGVAVPQLPAEATHEMAFIPAGGGNRRSALHIAVNCSDKSKGFACAQLLLSPVVAACAIRIEGASKRLLKDTAFKEELGGRRQTALHMAAMRGDLKLVTLLLEISKPFWELALVTDGVGFNAWHYAAFSGCSEVVETMFMFDTTMMFKEQDKTRIANIAEDGYVASEAIDPERDWTVESTAEHLLGQPAWTWWMKERMRYDEVFAASTDCVNALLVGASVAASVTYSAAVSTPAWFQAQVDAPNWLVAAEGVTLKSGEAGWKAGERGDLARAFISLNMASSTSQSCRL